MNDADTGSASVRRTASGTSLAPMFAVLALYVAISGTLALALDSERCVHGAWAVCDQIRHLGLINYLIERPASFLDYPDPWLVATLPGFHLLVALIARLFGLAVLGADTWLRLVPFGLGLAAVWILWRIYRDLSNNSAYASLLCLPILWSSYFYLPSLYLLTENGAYLGYVFLLMAYLRFPRRGLVIGLAGAAMVFTRQVYLPVIASHLLVLAQRAPRGRFERGRILAVLLGALPPMAIVVVYALAWHGLVPPEVRDLHSGRTFVEFGPIAQAIGLLGVLAIPYGFLAYAALHRLDRRRIAAMVAIAVTAALVFWLLVPTTQDLDAGRDGSFLWSLASISPAIGEHALFTLPFLILGLIAGSIMLELARMLRYLPIELVMLALYVAAMSMQLLSYQRYSEVLMLITLSATAARLELPSGVGAAAFTTAYAAKLALTFLVQVSQ